MSLHYIRRDAAARYKLILGRPNLNFKFKNCYPHRKKHVYTVHVSQNYQISYDFRKEHPVTQGNLEC